MERPAFDAEEHRAVVGIAGKLWSRLAQIFVDPRDGSFADGDDAVFLALALPDGERAALAVQVVELQVDQLGAADSRRVKRLQHGAVAQTQRLVDVGHEHYSLGFRFAQHRSGQTLLDLRHVEVGGRVVQDVIVPDQPAEPRTHRNHARVLRTEGQGLPILLAIVVKMPLVVLQHGPRHFHWLLDAVLVGPADEHRY